MEVYKFNVMRRKETAYEEKKEKMRRETEGSRQTI